MADRPLKMRDLRRTLARYGVWVDTTRGKGSHVMFLRRMHGSVFSYPVPTGHSDVPTPYVRGCRRKFELRPAHGVSDEEFYG